MAVIPNGEWRPDLPDIENPGGLVANNVVPFTSLSYAPWRQQAVISTNGLDSRPLGLTSGSDFDANVYNFAGDAGKLYRYSGTTFSDVSRVAGYSTSPTYFADVSRAWDFQQFDNYMIAANYSNDLQYFIMGVGSVFSNMAPLTAPKAKYMASVGSFLVVANTDDAFDGAVPLRLWISPIGNPALDDWGNTDQQSDFRTLSSGRQITGIVGGEVGYVFCETAIYQMTYTGPPTIFSTVEINSEHGCIAPDSIRQQEDKIFYLAEDGFQMMVNGQNLEIGLEKVNKYFLRDVNRQFIKRTVGAIDEARELYIVSYPSKQSVDGTPDRQLVYNYSLNRWTSATETLYLMNALQGAAVTVEALGALYPVVEDIPGSLDSSAFTGGLSFLAGFNTSNELIDFSGLPAAPTVETRELQLIDGQRATLRNIRPIVDARSAAEANGAFTIEVGKRDSQSGSVTYSAPVVQNTRTGLCSFRETARYHRARISCPEGVLWDEMIGVDGIEAVPAGN